MKTRSDPSPIATALSRRLFVGTLAGAAVAAWLGGPRTAAVATPASPAASAAPPAPGVERWHHTLLGVL